MTGKITVIVGPMFSGKSYELIRQINISRVSGKIVHVYKPPDRFQNQVISSRDGNQIEARILSTKLTCEQLINSFLGEMNYWDSKECEFDVVLQKGKPDLIAIDEVQFYLDEELPRAIRSATNQGISFLLSGLSRDFSGKPFGAMKSLLWMADSIIQLKSVCNLCKSFEGTRTVRVTNNQEQIVLESDAYQCLCVKCVEKLWSF